MEALFSNAPRRNAKPIEGTEAHAREPGVSSMSAPLPGLVSIDDFRATRSSSGPASSERFNLMLSDDALQPLIPLATQIIYGF